MSNIEALIWVSFWRAFEFQRFNWRVASNPRRQFKNIEMKYNTHIKHVHELYGTCFKYINHLRINHLTLLLIVIMPCACWFLWRADYVEHFKIHLHFLIWGFVLREVYFEGPNRVWRALKTSILNIARALIAKTKSDPSQGREATLWRSYILASCPGTNGRVRGSVLDA